MTFNQEKFNQFVIDNNIIGFFDRPVTLSSGIESLFYINWRTACEDLFLIDQTVQFLIDFVRDQKIQVDTFFDIKTLFWT